MNKAPVLAACCLFYGNIHHGQIEHLQQAVIRGEFEVGAQISPVILPGLGNLGIFLIPTL